MTRDPGMIYQAGRKRTGISHPNAISRLFGDAKRKNDLSQRDAGDFVKRMALYFHSKIDNKLLMMTPKSSLNRARHKILHAVLWSLT